MKKYVPLLFLFTLIAALPYAPEFTWTPPTRFVSGAVLNPETDLSEYRLYCEEALIATIPAPTLEYLTSANELSAGPHSCYLTAVDLALQESGPSGVVNFIVAADVPEPPVLTYN